MTKTAREPIRLLLIEDSKIDAILIEKALKKDASSAIDIKKAETLDKALRQIVEQPFDVILLDLSLPDTTGFSGLSSIQNMAPHVPVVILTAYADEETALSAVGSGAQDYLFKSAIDGANIRRAMRYAIRRKQFEATLIRQAHFDPLTGLANRLMFENRLEITLARRQRSGEGIAVFGLDLDRFKQVNDQYGHGIGDQLLQEVGVRLKQSTRASDTVARMGGDEFALIVDGVKKLEDCIAIASKIIAAMNRPFAVQGITLDVGISIGIAPCIGESCRLHEELIEQADQAMYAAKLVPESAYRLFSEEIQRQSVARSNASN